MVRWFRILIGALRSTVRTHRELALENLALRQQVAVWKALRPLWAQAQAKVLRELGAQTWAGSPRRLARLFHIAGTKRRRSRER